MSTFVNPPFEIVGVELHSGLDDFGDDIMHWWVRVRTDSYEVPVNVWFDMLVDYCKLQHPEVGAYYWSVFKSLKGFGPKQSRMFAIMDEESFDHMPHIYNYIKDCCNLEHYHLHDLKMKESTATVDGARQLQTKVASMQEGMPVMRAATIRNIAFKDHVYELLTQEVLSHYPLIFNSDPKYIEECEGILINAILSLGDKISSLSYRAEKDRE